jgi:hypothetical protein
MSRKHQLGALVLLAVILAIAALKAFGVIG